MRKLIVLKNGHTKWGLDSVSQVLPTALASNFVRCVGMTKELHQ